MREDEVPPGGTRDVLAGAVLDHLLAGAGGDGCGGAGGGDGLDRSLRSLAAAVGVGHSLLLYHFGSRDGLLGAVHEVCERRERAHLAAFAGQAARPEGAGSRAAPPEGAGHEGAGDEGVAAREVMRLMWRHLAEPRMWPVYRIAFALRARRPEPDGTREPWVQALLPLVRAVGVRQEGARAEALLWLATSRGLLWELVTGADPPAVDAAAEAFFAHYDR